MITRGTTPVLVFTLPFDVAIIKTAWVVFSQIGQEVLTVKTSECTFDGATITAKLTQEQTLLLNHNFSVDIQLRILTKDGEAMASNIIKTDTGKILKEGVIE